MHWTDRFSPAGRINPVVNADVDPISGQPELKHTPVAIAPYPARWHGFIISAEQLSPDIAEWTSLFPAGNAWRHELAGTTDPELEFARLRNACTVPGAWLVMRDPGHTVYRAALIEDGKLRACVFIGQTSALPARDWLVSLFAKDRITIEERRALLAGRPASGPLPEQPVCVCFGVGAREINTAIAAGCCTVDAVGAATQAGTNCGSCRPEIRGLLAQALVTA
jgi:assimilatory nitrate reductase catalytic subunit